MFRLSAAALGCWLTAACGFQPLYGTSGQVDVVREFAYVEIAPIRDRIGQLLRNELVQKMHATGRAPAVKYRLETDLREQTQSLAVQKSAFATRANLTVTANYQLLVASTKESLLRTSNRVTVSYNILDSEFATLMAARDARERAVRSLSEDIRIRLGIYFERN